MRKVITTVRYLDKVVMGLIANSAVGFVMLAVLITVMSVVLHYDGPLVRYLRHEVAIKTDSTQLIPPRDIHVSQDVEYDTFTASLPASQTDEVNTENKQLPDVDSRFEKVKSVKDKVADIVRVTKARVIVTGVPASESASETAKNKNPNSTDSFAGKLTHGTDKITGKNKTDIG